MTKEDLKEWRSLLGMTQEVFSKSLGMGARNYKMIESGSSKIPKYVQIIHENYQERKILKKTIKEKDLEINLSHRSTESLNRTKKILIEQIEDRKIINQRDFYLSEDKKLLQKINEELEERK